MKDTPDVDVEVPSDSAVVVIEIQTTAEALIRLVELHETGLYGHSVEETAERAMCSWLAIE